MKRENSQEISEIKSNLYSLICLYHDKPDIVTRTAEDILSNKYCKYVTKQRHMRYDHLLLYLYWCYLQFNMQWNSSDELNGTGNSLMIRVFRLFLSHSYFVSTIRNLITYSKLFSFYVHVVTNYMLFMLHFYQIDKLI